MSRSGLSPSDCAIVGKAVAITVESRLCMNSAQATISGTRIGQEARVPPTGLSDVEIAAGPLDDGAPDTDSMSGEQIFGGMGHRAKIGRVGFRQKRRASIAALMLLAACSGPAVVENSATAVTVRYDAIDGIDEATTFAQKACAAHHKAARLRNTANFGLTDRYAHFDCV